MINFFLAKLYLIFFFSYSFFNLYKSTNQNHLEKKKITKLFYESFVESFNLC